ncbi:MAG TPA: M48 family metalloprotease [Terriglobales bacterium]|nr:M48 family metalloprotease [Terriglobales bacterium]
MRRFGLFVVIALLVGGLALSQWRKPQAYASPDAVLHFIGETERELSRLPLSATRLSNADEIRLGNRLAEQYAYIEERDQDDPDINETRQYIDKVGRMLALRANRKLPYKFHYIPDRNMVNAFAIPGGHVYIGLGLLDMMDSEDELASILGHELEHIDRYHAMDRMQVEARLRHLGVFRVIAQVPIALFQAGYSKEQELEADREGTRLAVMAGYSATGAVRILEAFQRKYEEVEKRAKSPQEEVGKVVLATMSEYFRSHPPTNERAAQIRDLMISEKWAPGGERPLQIAYLLWTGRAEQALESDKYRAAEGFATQALQNKPEFERALRLLARAQYLQANFKDASATYARLLKLKPYDGEYIRAFADGITDMLPEDSGSVRQMFETWMKSAEASSTDTWDVKAGIELRDGRPAEAERLIADLKAHPASENNPERMSRIAWWYYRAQDYPRAFSLLESAAQQRPGDGRILTDFAWAAIELQRYQQAIANLQGTRSKTDSAEMAMASAVAHWLAQDKTAALSEYRQAVNQEPAWENRAWVAPQYSTTVLRAISEIKQELEWQKRSTSVADRRAQ